jgi:hypothetical protein
MKKSFKISLPVHNIIQCFSLMVLCTLISRVTLLTNTDLYFRECDDKRLKGEQGEMHVPG